MYKSPKNTMLTSIKNKSMDKVSIYNPFLNAFCEVSVEVAKKFVENAKEVEKKIKESEAKVKEGK